MPKHEHHHPTQSVAPGADPYQDGPDPVARWVDPKEAILAEFLPTTQEPEQTSGGHAVSS